MKKKMKIDKVAKRCIVDHLAWFISLLQGYYIPLTKFAALSALAEIIKNVGVEVKALSLRGNGLLHLNDVAKTFGGEARESSCL